MHCCHAKYHPCMVHNLTKAIVERLRKPEPEWNQWNMHSLFHCFLILSISTLSLLYCSIKQHHCSLFYTLKLWYWSNWGLGQATLSMHYLHCKCSIEMEWMDCCSGNYSICSLLFNSELPYMYIENFFITYMYTVFNTAVWKVSTLNNFNNWNTCKNVHTPTHVQ